MYIHISMYNYNGLLFIIIIINLSHIHTYMTGVMDAKEYKHVHFSSGNLEEL